MFGFNKLNNREEKWRRFEAEALPLQADLFRTALWLTRDRTDAEDLVQETMFQALRSFHLYESGTNCKAWLLRIMHVHNVRRLRSSLKLRLVSDNDGEITNAIPFEPPIPDKITDDEVVSAIKQMPPHFREVVVLSDIENLSYKEISSVIGLPMGTVMSRLSRGRRLLRIELAEFAKRAGFTEVMHAAK
jgi:RNA polymerase sigma-70 factor (ECF subfamily)